MIVHAKGVSLFVADLEGVDCIKVLEMKECRWG